MTKYKHIKVKDNLIEVMPDFSIDVSGIGGEAEAAEMLLKLIHSGIVDKEMLLEINHAIQIIHNK